MITPPAGVRIYLAMGPTDMRKGFDDVAALVQDVLGRNPFSGYLFLFRGRRGDWTAEAPAARPWITTERLPKYAPEPALGADSGWGDGAVQPPSVYGSVSRPIAGKDPRGDEP